MEKKFKNIAWFSLASLACVAFATLFGMLAITSIKDEGLKTLKTYLTIVILIAALVLVITNIMSFISLRNGEVKSTILSVAKQSRIQNIGPLLALVLSVLGIVVPAVMDDKDPNRTLIILVVVTYALATFATAFNGRGLKAYRKDKETFSYIYVSSFITAVGLILFAIVSLICMVKIPKLEGTHLVGYTIACSLFFILADVVSYVCLGIVTLYAQKMAPKLTLADADAKKLDDLNKNVEKLVNKDTKENHETDNIAKLREYKQLLDDGVITQEEFNQKKKELL